jgi:hypothetical protein
MVDLIAVCKALDSIEPEDREIQGSFQAMD